MLISTFKQALPFIFKSGVAPMVIGHHGIGKSQGVKQYAKENGYDFVDLRLGTQDVGDLLGLADFKRDSQGNLIATRFFQPDWFPTDPDAKVIIFLDEINRARRDVLQAVFQLVLDKRLHRYELPKNCHVLAAMNPNTEDYIVTDISDKAFLDRFLFVKLTPSVKEWLDYAEGNNFESETVNFIAENPEMLESKLEDFSLKDMVKPSRRSWEFVDNFRRINKTGGMPDNIMQELCIGMVGYEAAASYKAYIEKADKDISGEEIVLNFPKYKKKIKELIDVTKGGKMALIKKTCDNLIKYVKERDEKGAAFEDKEAKNIGDFLMLIPKDTVFQTLRTMYPVKIAQPVLDNHKELKKALADNRNIKIKGLNA